MKITDMKDVEFLEGDSFTVTEKFEPGLKDVLKLLLGYPITAKITIRIDKIGRRYHRDPATNKRIETEFVRLGDEAVTLDIKPDVGFSA